MILSVGINDYSTLEGHANIPSASFDSILVANRFESMGFTGAHLMNPTKEELLVEIRRIKVSCEHIYSLEPLKLKFVVIYFSGYATDDNEVIFSDGDVLSISKYFESPVKNTYVLLFQDCTTNREGGSYGNIHCQSLGHATNSSYFYQALFRSDNFGRFLKFQTNALLT